MKRFILIFAVLLLFAGCAYAPFPTPQARVDKDFTGQPQEYREGVKAGCGSGYFAAGNPDYKQFDKDVSRYTSDEVYKAGWDDGFNLCKEKYEAWGRALMRSVDYGHRRS